MPARRNRDVGVLFRRIAWAASQLHQTKEVAADVTRDAKPKNGAPYPPSILGMKNTSAPGGTG